MGKYFADVHASYKSQFENLPHGLTDTDEILACRTKLQTYETLLELADALCWQLRFREAIDALTQAIALEPERMEAYCKRGPKYLDTLQFERALADYTRCEQTDGVSVESRYRVGMAHYLMRKYDDAIRTDREYLRRMCFPFRMLKPLVCPKPMCLHKQPLQCLNRLLRTSPLLIFFCSS